jgi:glycosyltransferase involved in cell wall biosynthesis
MQNQPLISVIMPAYNAEKYIQEAIDSILNQSYSNLELLIFDDGSSDATRSVIDGYSDERIVKIYADKNSGVVAARNHCIDLAKGKYIALMDADDIASHDRFEKQVTLLEADGCDVCGSEHWHLNQSTGVLKASKDRHTDADLRALLSVYCSMCNSAVMARSEIIKQYKYDATIPVAEDYHLWVTLAVVGYRFANLPERLITYRQYPEQSSSKYVDKFRLATIEIARQYLQNLGIPPPLLPVKTPLPGRISKAWQFLTLLNKKIPGISYAVNCEIYARFQHKKPRIWSPLRRVERWIISLALLLCARLR